MLYWTPSTGKTLLTKAVAHHTDCRVTRVSLSLTRSLFKIFTVLVLGLLKTVIIPGLPSATSWSCTLHRLNTGRQVRIVAANRLDKQKLFRYQRHIGTYLIMGGVDVTGAHLYEIAAHDCTS